MKQLILTFAFALMFLIPFFAKASGSVIEPDDSTFVDVSRIDNRKFERGKMYDYSHADKRVLLGNPLVVIYPDGPHGIVGEPGVTHEGIDFVIRDLFDKWKFRQWFYGTSSEEEGIDRDYSIWEPAKKCGISVKKWFSFGRENKEQTESVQSKSLCPKGWILVPNAQQNWGDYLKPNTDYCVYTQGY